MNPPRRRGPLLRLAEAPGNPFGLLEALLGYVGGYVVTIVLLVIYEEASGHHPKAGYAIDVTGLVGLWTGFVLAAVFALRRADPRRPGRLRRFADAYGVAIRPLVDVPLGIVAGLFAQFPLAFVLELPLRPFVPHLETRLSQPAHSLTAGVNGAGLVVLAVLVCVGSPAFEELFFRGLVLRALVGAARDRMHLGPRTAGVCAVASSAVVFGLAHFEANQLTALIGAGAVFGLLAAMTGRLGPGFIAHMTFNTVTIVALVSGH